MDLFGTGPLGGPEMRTEFTHTCVVTGLVVLLVGVAGILVTKALQASTSASPSSTLDCVYFQCAKCGHTFELSPQTQKKALDEGDVAWPEVGRTLFRCPNCGALQAEKRVAVP